MWTQNASVLQFYIPILLGASCFPFLAAPTRSIFTVAVNAKPALSKYHGLMQSILSMGASVAGFVTPGIVAAFCLRHPDVVAASRDHRELSPLSLFAPVLSALVLFGMLYLRVSGKISNKKDDGEGTMTESSSLLPGHNDIAARRDSALEMLMEKDYEGFSGMVDNISVRE